MGRRLGARRLPRTRLPRAGRGPRAHRAPSQRCRSARPSRPRPGRGVDEGLREDRRCLRAKGYPVEPPPVPQRLHVQRALAADPARSVAAAYGGHPRGSELRGAPGTDHLAYARAQHDPRDQEPRPRRGAAPAAARPSRHLRGLPGQRPARQVLRRDRAGHSHHRHRRGSERRRIPHPGSIAGVGTLWHPPAAGSPGQPAAPIPYVRGLPVRGHPDCSVCAAHRQQEGRKEPGAAKRRPRDPRSPLLRCTVAEGLAGRPVAANAAGFNARAIPGPAIRCWAVSRCTPPPTPPPPAGSTSVSAAAAPRRPMVPGTLHVGRARHRGGQDPRHAAGDGTGARSEVSTK